MRSISYAMALLFVVVIHTHSHSQSLRHFERKAKKTFKKEAFGMSLYYSQAILKIDSLHTDALYWASQASEKLHLSDKPTNFIAHLPKAQGPDFPIEDFFEIENKPDALDSALAAPLTLIIQTFNSVDSSAVNGTYIGLTNDGFGKGEFIQNNENENTAVFKIPADKFFTVTGTKNTFSSGSATISSSDKIKRDTIYRQLYLSPSWGLPLALYFDHEKPSSFHPADSTTNLDYEQTWIDYLYRIENYLVGNTSEISKTDKAIPQKMVDLFFAGHVDAHFYKLVSFCELLGNYLATGKKITLNIEGYAGLYEQMENKDALIKRRINSIENYFSFYRNGLLKPWQSNGQLKIKRLYRTGEMPIGKAGMDIENVYAPEIAKMRKVVISLCESL